MPHLVRLIAVLVLCGPLVPFLVAQLPVADAMGGEGPRSLLEFSVTDPDGRLIPARLTFRAPGEVEPALFTNSGAAPDLLAVRRNVVYGRTQSADPWAHLVHALLRPGWNRVLLKVWNATGDFGFRMRVLDDGVRWALVPEEAAATGSR